MVRFRDIVTLTTFTTAFFCLTLLGCKDEATNVDDTPKDTCEHWTYEGEHGPEHWKDLCPDYADCGGQAQSPINLAGAITDLTLGDITFSYDSSATAIKNNGHTIQWTDDGGSSISYRGTTYVLEQFHLHTPGEHTVSGITYPMELHLVHEDSATGKLAVVGVLFVAGAENPFLAQFIDKLPASADETFNDAAKYLIGDVLPVRRAYYTYGGSLTTPPCSEIVTWLVMQNPVQASQTQLDALMNIMHENNRPVQPLGGRQIRSHG